MADQIDSVALVYARSLFELAQQAGGPDKVVEVGDELEQISELSRSDRRFGEFTRSPIIQRTARARALNTIFSDNVTDLVLRFLLVLNDKGRLGHLEHIASAYDHLVHESYGRIEVDVFTPMPLEAGQRDSIKERIQSALGREPILYPYTDPSMIGGIKLRIEDQLIDASVSTRLRRMRDQLLRQGASSMRANFDAIVDDDGASG